MRRTRRVKILATLGPASSAPATIDALFRAGADTFRINMSHTSREAMRTLVATIRDTEKAHDRPIGILVDLQGPKFRIGSFAEGSIEVSPGHAIVLDRDPTPGDATRVELPHPEIFNALRPGHRLLLDDGRVHLVAEENENGRIIARVVSGYRLSDRKGVSIPDTLVSVSAMSAKDHSDLDAALDAGVEWIALSFVQRPEDVAEVKKVARGRAGVLAKIEKPQAVDRLPEIIDIADALMVARGDLGVEMPLERVPGIQKRIVRACRRAGKPVVVATQMLESMVTAAVPTRAEVSDVATAVYEGADAVMLSAESATGAYPVEAVATIDRIADAVERDAIYRSIIDAQRTEPEATGADAISAASRQIAETLNLAAICCYTASGATGLRTARERPQTPILALSPVLETARRLSLVWGLHCVVGEDAHDFDDMVRRASGIAFREGYARPGDRILITAGVPFGTPGATNVLHIAYVGGKDEGGG